MNGLGFLLAVGIGTIVGATWERLRRGGILDLQQCLTLGHQRPGRDSRCPRCTRRVLMVAP